MVLVPAMYLRWSTYLQTLTCLAWSTNDRPIDRTRNLRMTHKCHSQKEPPLAVVVGESSLHDTCTCSEVLVIKHADLRHWLYTWPTSGFCVCRSGQCLYCSWFKQMTTTSAQAVQLHCTAWADVVVICLFFIVLFISWQVNINRFSKCWIFAAVT